MSLVYTGSNATYNLPVNSCTYINCDIPNVFSILMVFQIQASTKHVNESIAKQIHEKAAPVVAWLRTAEEESSGEEEEEDEVEVVYSENAGAKGITTVTEKPTQPAEEVCSVCVCVCVCV